MTTDDEFFANLDSLGEDEVRRQVANGEYGPPSSQRRSVVELWLQIKEESRNAASEARSEATEDGSLSIARDANSLSRKALFNSRLANIIAIIAMILSTITAIVAASDKVILFLQRFGVLKP